MKDFKFRLLNADEIECRVGTQAKDNSWVTLLLYKDARVDMRLLDEVVGAMNWKREHQLIDGQLFCTISIWDEDKKEWVGKQDVGTESNTEAEKGRASDACKRSCFNWGIGRELYTAPFIFIKAEAGDLRNGKFAMTFSVKSIGYTDGVISSLEIVDKNGKSRYTLGQPSMVVPQEQPKSVQFQQTPQQYDKMIQALCAMVQSCNSMQELTDLRNRNIQYKDDQTFRDALNARATIIKQNAA